MASRRFISPVERAQGRAAQNRAWHRPFDAQHMPWRVVVDGELVALFVDERNARGFARARYGDDATIERRKASKVVEAGDEVRPHRHAED
jgi:hypothetical protein